MSIKYDESGFLLGEKRLTELNKGVAEVSHKTTEILELLYALIQLDIKERQSQLGERQKLTDAIANAVAKPTKLAISITGAGGKATKVTGNTVALNVAKESTAGKPTANTSKPKASVTGVKSRDSQGRFTSSQVANTTSQDQASRDASGRFVGKAQGISDKSNFIDSVKRGIESSKNLAPDVGGIDPTVDALRELHGVFSPAGRAFGLMGRGANWLFKKAKPKKSEDIPRIQDEHYTEVERHNYEQRKLFKKLIDAVNRQNSSGLLGKLAGLASLLSALAGNGGNGRNGRNAPLPVPDKNKKPDGRKPVPAPIPDKGKKGPESAKTGRLGRLLGKVPLVGALLGGGLLASQWDDMSAVEKGGNVGSVTGGLIGSVAGSVIGPFGTVGGGFAGAHIGEKIGQKVGEWTGGLKSQDIGGSIVKKWNETVDGIDKLVKYSWLKSITGMVGMGGGFMRASYGSGDYSGGTGTQGTIASSTTKEQNENQTRVYNSMLKAGFNQQQALALTAEVGRENGYDSKYLYGSHKDAANGKKNIGMISWQGSRGTKLYNYMAKQGLINADGSMKQGQESLDAQARFMRDEIQNNSEYAATKSAFENKNASAESLAKVVGKNYIGWAYGQSRLKSGKAFDWQAHDKKRRGYLHQMEKKVETGSTAPQGKAVLVNAKNAQAAKPVKVSGSAPVAKTQIAPEPTIKKAEKKQPQPIWANSQGGISQNVADRDVAHALTGGMGMRVMQA